MGRPESEKRQVKYADLEQMVADVESLHANGYTRSGQWSLAQACGHIAEWMRFPMDGFPTPPLFMRAIFGVMRLTGAAKSMARKIESEGFKGGMPTAPETVPSDSISDAEGLTKLKQVVERLKGHQQPLHPSPLFGAMDLQRHIKVTLLHAEHHFGYLHPKT